MKIKRLILSLTALLLCVSSLLAQTDITRHGVKPSNFIRADAEANTVAFQTLMDANNGGRYYAPAAGYLFNRTIELKKATFILDGAGVPSGGSGFGTGFSYNGPGAVFHAAPHPLGPGKPSLEGRFTFSNLHINNWLGDGIVLEGSTFHNRFLNCNFEGCGLSNPDYVGTGLQADYADCLEVYSCHFGSNDVGAKICGNADVRLATVMGNGDGVWLAHYGNVFSNFRVEVNKRGLVLGMRAPALGKTNDRPHIFQYSEISNGTMEANDIAIDVARPTANVEISRIRIYGTTGSPSKQSQIGIYVQGPMIKCDVVGVDCTGGYAKGAIVFTKQAAALADRLVFRNCSMKSNHNGVSNPQREWVLEEKPGVFRRLKLSDVPGVKFEGCNFPTAEDLAIYEAEKAQ